MIYISLSVLLVGLVSSQEEGESCVEQYTNTVGVCTKECKSARNDYEKSRITPTFCRYNTFDTPLVCCRDGSSILQAAYRRSDRPVWGNAAINDGRRVSERKCEEYSRPVTQRLGFIALSPDPEELSITVPKCDYNSIGLIIGGENAALGEFPHMAAIGWADFEGGYTFSCGGSLISPRFVVTAGHCQRNVNAKDPEPVIVRLGDQNIDNRVSDGAEPIDVPIRHVHVHPMYDPPRVYNDIALLELATDISFKSSIRPACLWTRPDFGGFDNVVATGWGVINTRTKEASSELQKVSLSLIENEECDTLLLSNRNRNWRGMASSQMCAGELSGGKDTCQGDSGGPIQVVTKENHCIFHIMGVTSFGKNCGESGRSGVYTRISSYLDWIESVVWPGE